MTWPTDEQVEEATKHGVDYACNEIANGNAAPQDGPLSGEWAGGLVPKDVALNVGWLDPHGPDSAVEAYDDGIDSLADAWENGYFETWRAHCGEDCT